jgi:hypothetical protein
MSTKGTNEHEGKIKSSCLFVFFVDDSKIFFVSLRVLRGRFKDFLRVSSCSSWTIQRFSSCLFVFFVDNLKEMNL